MTTARRCNNQPRRKTIHTTLLAMTEQLAQLLKAHVPLPQALTLLQYSLPQTLNQAIMRHLSIRIQQGLRLHQAMAELPHVFQPLYQHIIAISEQSAQLAAGLDCLHQYLHQDLQLKQQLQQALSYPIVLTVATLSALFFLLYWVIPHFAELLQTTHAILPASTRYALWASRQCHTYPGRCLAMMVTTFGSTWLTIRQLPVTLRYRIPILGRAWQLIQRTQQLSLLALIAQAKLPWPTGIALISSHATTHQHAWQRTYQALLHGQALHAALAQHPLFHRALCAQLATAEQSGQLTITLNHLWQQHTHSTHHTLQRLKRQLEPLFTLGTGCMIMAVVVLLYLPLLQLGDALWSTSMGP